MNIEGKKNKSLVNMKKYGIMAKKKLANEMSNKQKMAKKTIKWEMTQKIANYIMAKLATKRKKMMIWKMGIVIH